MFVAIRVREGITGLLSLVTTTYNRDWSQADIELANAVADQSAIAIRQAELYSQAEALSQRESLINRLGTAIRSSLQLSEVLHTATHELGMALGASRVYIRFYNELRPDIISPAEHVYAVPGENSPPPPDVRYKEIPRRDLPDKRQTIVVNDTSSAGEKDEFADYLRQKVGARGVLSSVYCPIWIKDGFRGTLCIEQNDRVRRWTENDVALIESVAAQLSLGIAHAELFELTRRAKREWEVTFDAMSDGVFIFDRSGILQRVNRAGAEMELTTPQKLVGKNCCEIMPLEDNGETACVVQQAMKARDGVTVERRSKALQRPLLITAEPVFGDRDELIGVVVTGRDLYELREAEAVAREREFLLTHVLEGILEPIFAVDKNGKLLWCNGATEETYGIPAAKLNGLNFTQLVYAEDRELAQTALQASLKKLPQSYESRYINSKGELRYAVFSSVPLVEENEINGVLWFVRDITEQKTALQQALQADKLRALGQLASGVAHDFNNVLAAILGRVSLLQRQISDQSITQNLNVIQTAAEDAAATVRRIQTFARQSAAPDFVPIEIGALLRDSIELTRTRWEDDARQRGISYAVELAAEDAVFAFGNASELREVFVNLIVNALDAMPRGGRLEISCRNLGDSVVLEFSDEGEGISDEVRERIFEPFFSTKGVNGSGLGLSVSYSIIKQHEGTITVESELGKGTTFSIALPVHNSHETQTAPVMPQNGKKTLSVLVVDDEDFVREALVEMVSELASEVVGAASPKQAIQQLEKQRFDVVFTDLSMPEMDGWDLARTIRQNWGETKTVLVTGYGKGVAQNPEKRELVYTIIGKPFDFEQLSQTLEKISAEQNNNQKRESNGGGK